MKYSVLILVITITISKIECCTTDKDCPALDSVCIESKCTCQQGFFLNSNGSKCISYVTEYNGECSEDAQCEWLGENSRCSYVCTCQEGYRWYQGKCMKFVGLGDACTDNIDCFDGYSLQSLSCQEGKCTCSADYYQRGDYDCRKKAANENDICALDIDCQLPNTICARGKCKSAKSQRLLIQEEEEEIEQTVFTYQSSAGRQCTSNNDCVDIPNTECYEKTGTCICKKGYFFEKDGTKCIPELGVDAKCTSDSDCSLRPGKCDIESGICYCRDYYFVDDGNRNCIKTISENNWNCVSKEWCYALGEYSFCSSVGICNCSKLSDFDKENVFCKWNGQEDPDRCISDHQCKYIRGGYCIDEACGCPDKYILQGDVCYPNAIGVPCDEEIGCKMENAECLDNTCQCLEGCVPYNDTKCYTKNDKIGDKCEVDVQCEAGITFSKCVEGKCDCLENYLAHNNTCYERKEQNAYCNNLLECQISLGKSFACRNRMCQCPTGYTIKGTECSSSAVINGSFLVIALALVLKGIF